MPEKSPLTTRGSGRRRLLLQGKIQPGATPKEMKAWGSPGIELLLPGLGSAGTVPAEAAGLKPRAVFSPGSARLTGALGSDKAAAQLASRHSRARHCSLSEPTTGKNKHCLPAPKKLFRHGKNLGGQRELRKTRAARLQNAPAANKEPLPAPAPHTSCPGLPGLKDTITILRVQRSWNVPSQ